jgi:hypothetical protein
MKHPNLSIEIDKVQTEARLKEIPYIVDYIMGNSVVTTKRGAAVEEKRSILTSKIKNLVLYFLTKVKKEKKRSSFKEVISNIILQKKNEMKRERMKQLIPGAKDEDLTTVKDGLSKT